MKKIISSVVAVSLLALVFTGCSEEFKGKTITTNVVTMTVPEDATAIIDNEALQIYQITGDGYTISAILMTAKGTASIVNSFQDSDYETYKTESATQLMEAFADYEDLADGKLTFADKMERIKLGGQDALKITATVAADNATGVMNMYITGNSSDSVVIYFITQLDKKDASVPTVVNQMAQSVKFN